MHSQHVARKGRIGFKGRASAQDAELVSTTMRLAAVLSQHARTVHLESTTMRLAAVLSQHAKTANLELTIAKLGVTLVRLARLAHLAGTAALKFLARFQIKFVCLASLANIMSTQNLSLIHI